MADATPEPVRVLIVDDDEAFRLISRTVLKRAGIEVVAEAQDGEEGLSLAEQHQPDVVLLDLLMPNLDGFETLPRMCRLLPSARVFILTALDEREATREAALVGAAGFVEKRHADRLVDLIRREQRGASVAADTGHPGDAEDG